MAFKAKELNIAGLQNSLAMRLVCLQVLPQVRQLLRQLQCQRLRQRWRLQAAVPQYPRGTWGGLRDPRGVSALLQVELGWTVIFVLVKKNQNKLLQYVVLNFNWHIFLFFFIFLNSTAKYILLLLAMTVWRYINGIIGILSKVECYNQN